MEKNKKGKRKDKKKALKEELKKKMEKKQNSNDDNKKENENIEASLSTTDVSDSKSLVSLDTNTGTSKENESKVKDETQETNAENIDQKQEENQAANESKVKGDTQETNTENIDQKQEENQAANESKVKGDTQETNTEDIGQKQEENQTAAQILRKEILPTESSTEIPENIFTKEISTVENSTGENEVLYSDKQENEAHDSDTKNEIDGVQMTTSNDEKVKESAKQNVNLEVVQHENAEDKGRGPDETIPHSNALPSSPLTSKQNEHVTGQDEPQVFGSDEPKQHTYENIVETKNDLDEEVIEFHENNDQNKSGIDDPINAELEQMAMDKVDKIEQSEIIDNDLDELLKEINQVDQYINLAESSIQKDKDDAADVTNNLIEDNVTDDMIIMSSVAMLDDEEAEDALTDKLLMTTLPNENNDNKNKVNIEAMAYESEYLTRRIQEGKEAEKQLNRSIEEKDLQLQEAQRKLKDLQIRLIRFARDDEAKDRHVASLERELKEINKRLEEVLDDYQNRIDQKQSNHSQYNVMPSQQNTTKQSHAKNDNLKSKTCVIL